MSADQDIPNSVSAGTAIVFDVETIDTSGLHDDTDNRQRWYAPTPGSWRMEVFAGMEGGGAGQKLVWIRHTRADGSTFAVPAEPLEIDGTNVILPSTGFVAATFDMREWEWLEVLVFQNTGATIKALKDYFVADFYKRADT
jgi:hypothetical protein